MALIFNRALTKGIIYWPKLVHDDTRSYANLECSIDDGILPDVQVRDVMM